MPHPELDPDQWLRRYARERDAVANEALRRQQPWTQSVLADVRDALSRQSQAPADVQQLLGGYVEQRDDIASRIPPIDRAEIQALVAEAAPRRTTSAGPGLNWWEWMRQHWRVTAPIAAAAAVLLLVFVARESGQPGSSPVRVVFATASLRGGDPATRTNGVLSLPCTLEFDWKRLMLKFVQHDGSQYAGSLTAGELLQTSPWKKRFAIMASGKNAAGDVVELRGTLTLTLEGEAPVTPGAPAAKVLGAILELQPRMAGRTLKNLRLEFPE